MALRQRISLHHHDEANDIVVEQRPGAGAMRQNEIALQLAKLLVVNADAGELAETGVDAVYCAPRGNEVKNGALARFDSLLSAGGQRDAWPLPQDRPPRLERDLSRRDHYVICP